jgi:hypothetical protein
MKILKLKSGMNKGREDFSMPDNHQVKKKNKSIDY